MAYSHHEVPFAPVQYPLMDNISPVPPVRSEYSGNQYEQDRYRPPTPPDREDKPLTRSRPAPESRRVNIIKKIFIQVFFKRIDYIRNASNL